MLKHRIITAIVLLALIAASIALSLKAFEALLAVAFGLVFYEWLKIIPLRRYSVNSLSFLFFVFALSMVFFGWRVNPKILLFLHLVVAALWLALVAVIFNARHVGYKITRKRNILLAFLFPVTAWLSVVYLMDTGGWQLLLSVFMFVWFADIFAYVFGLSFGKHRLARAISPKKSWEGVFGAYLCVFLGAFIAYMTLPPEYVATSLIMEKAGPVAGILIMFLLVSICIVGDLFESALKRQAGVKDSNNLLPGHGGFFDRLDAAVAVLPSTVAVLLLV